MQPTYPKILRDRDNYRKWYLAEQVTVFLHNGDEIEIPEGYRFDAHSVPFVFRFLFPRTKGVDIYAAMVHDYLIDIEMFLRYNRKFQDYEYKRFMNMPEYVTSKTRSYWMPKAVRLWGFLIFDIWGDFRGEDKYHTKLKVRVEQHDKI